MKEVEKLILHLFHKEVRNYVEQKGEGIKRVYVAGLYSRNPDGSQANIVQALGNMRRGQMACLQVWRAGFAPFCPWQDYQYSLLDDQPITKEMYQTLSMRWLEVSDAVLVISGEGIGSGVDREIARAMELGIPIFRSLEELVHAAASLA